MNVHGSFDDSSWVGMSLLLPISVVGEPPFFIYYGRCKRKTKESQVGTSAQCLVLNLSVLESFCSKQCKTASNCEHGKVSFNRTHVRTPSQRTGSAEDRYQIFFQRFHLCFRLLTQTAGFSHVASDERNYQRKTGQTSLETQHSRPGQFANATLANRHAILPAHITM